MSFVIRFYSRLPVPSLFVFLCVYCDSSVKTALTARQGKWELGVGKSRGGGRKIQQGLRAAPTANVRNVNCAAFGVHFTRSCCIHVQKCSWARTNPRAEDGNQGVKNGVAGF